MSLVAAQPSTIIDGRGEVGLALQPYAGYSISKAAVSRFAARAWHPLPRLPRDRGRRPHFRVLQAELEKWAEQEWPVKLEPPTEQPSTKVLREHVQPIEKWWDGLEPREVMSASRAVLVECGIKVVRVMFSDDVARAAIEWNEKRLRRRRRMTRKKKRGWA